MSDLTGLLTILSLCGISTSCPSVCTCNGNQTDCSDLNQLISLDSILDQLPSHATSLTLSNNNFTTVEPGSFSNLSGLLHLDLSRNLLSTFHPSSFSQLNSLEFLDVSENRLVMLPVSLFSDLRRLAELVLKDNRLKELNPDQFKGLTELKRLDLSLNHLSSLHTNLLDGLQKLAWLSVVGNQLTTLHRDSLKQAMGLQHLLMEGNPWNCNCELIPLKHRIEWILYKGGHIDSVHCSYPTNLRGKDLCNIPTEMFGHCHYLHFMTRNPPAADSHPGSSGDCIHQRYRPVSVRRAAATVVVAGVVCGVVCILMVVTATYGCIYAMMAANEQQQLNQGDNHQQPLMSAKEPEQDLMNEQKEDLMPSIRRGTEWMAFPPEVCV
ncbi:leucine-rich repeat and transmembrane domain-containing protein 2 isoform X1 [Triplophysa rosa]|uniref:leucine-rich repeat and transmembrane domain-containing protein 2 isoform X1 n=1 Tax=Triplophysa rosa TaxID=992332 RepID=UPI0025463535|nr:leucine-rich repeat and transmembrane domain-containing protein 2 isoform X1 [Triplophysa rosa]